MYSNSNDGMVRDGDVVEFTLHGERQTAIALLVTEDGLVLLDLIDGDRPAWAWLTDVAQLTVFRDDSSDLPTAA